MVRALPASTAKSGCAARTRAANSATLEMAASSAGPGSARRSGTGSGWTCSSCSPGTCSGARLVTRTRISGQRCSRPASSSAASSRCSKLSRTSSAPHRRRYRHKVTGSGCAPASRNPSGRATAGKNWPGSRTGAKSTNTAPGSPRTTSRASRVLPDPPAPTNVSRRPPASNTRAPASSRSRPIRGVNGTGKSPAGSSPTHSG
jgi:hypothetical protein